MNKRKTTLLDKERGNSQLINKMQDFLKIYGIYENKKFLEIFDEIYISDKNLTHTQIENKYFISNSTLKRYIEIFDDIAKIILNVKGNEKDFSKRTLRFVEGSFA